jgi:hypothetical protein
MPDITTLIVALLGFVGVILTGTLGARAARLGREEDQAHAERMKVLEREEARALRLTEQKQQVYSELLRAVSQLPETMATQESAIAASERRSGSVFVGEYTAAMYQTKLLLDPIRQTAFDAARATFRSSHYRDTAQFQESITPLLSADLAES